MKKIILIGIIIFFLVIFGSLFLIKKGKFLGIKREIPSELKIKDLVKGKGRKAEKGKKLTVHYIGKLENGKVFDNTYEKGRPFSFVLGKGNVIKGWEIGIEGMREGGKRRLIIPPHLGYGESGVRGLIPPNSTIIFEIELIKVE